MTCSAKSDWKEGSLVGKDWWNLRKVAVLEPPSHQSTDGSVVPTKQSFGCLIGRGKDMRSDLHGQEVVPEGADVGRMR